MGLHWAGVMSALNPLQHWEFTLDRKFLAEVADALLADARRIEAAPLFLPELDAVKSVHMKWSVVSSEYPLRPTPSAGAPSG